ATGLIGSSVLQLLLRDDFFTIVSIFVRKPTGISHPKLKEYVVNYDHLSLVKDKIVSDVIFNCLGTTLKVAGSKENQQIIDRDYPIVVAKIASENGVKKIINVSSIGSDSNSANFYLKTKGEMEMGVEKYMPNKSYFFRPSFLKGDRKEFRLGEKVAVFFMFIADALLIGNMQKWHSIKDVHLAQAMINVAKKTPSNTVFTYKEIIAYR
ncbi:MAG: NAD(P)H-binding protein, partial [Pseudarcicella sp.]|nr:NAD(P)H-binding protein [Pseudarcicella sp.]